MHIHLNMYLMSLFLQAVSIPQVVNLCNFYKIIGVTYVLDMFWYLCLTALDYGINLLFANTQGYCWVGTCYNPNFHLF